MKPGDSIRFEDGNSRIKYDPEWSKSKPYFTYYKGTAGLAFASLRQAMIYCGDNFPVIGK